MQPSTVVPSDGGIALHKWIHRGLVAYSLSLIWHQWSSFVNIFTWDLLGKNTNLPYLEHIPQETYNYVNMWDMECAANMNTVLGFCQFAYIL